jgi:CheY-specific phosphatase CheX
MSMNHPLDHHAPLDRTLVSAVVRSAMEVMGTMAQTQLEHKEIEGWEYYRPTGDISAVIGIFDNTGEGGMLSLTFPMTLARLLVSRLLTVNPASLSSEDVCDGVRELVNMVSGSTKAFLSEGSDNMYKLSLPAVILGGGHEIFNRPENNPYLLIQFKTIEEASQKFNLQVCFKQKM